ncbi:MAG: UDP-glucuronic acid decarboxylase family protein [Alistipes sp.]
MKRILISGGAGFIGSHLCERLLSENNDVICLDNYFTGSKDNVRHLLSNNNFELVCHDVTLPYYAAVDEIYNLACPASPTSYQIDPVKTTRTSVVGAINMLDLAVQNRAKILQASTSEVYGDPIIHPQAENYWGHVNPLGPRSCYDEGKRCAESLFISYQRQHNLPVKIVRIFNTYGPNMDVDDGRVVSNFIVQALRNKDITIYGNGSQTRSFQYIDDLVEGLIRMMNVTPKGYAGPINIGNPNEFTMLELAQIVLELTGSSSKIIFGELPVDDPQQRRPDIALAKQMLNGWEPTIQLREGLERTIAYFDNQLRTVCTKKEPYIAYSSCGPRGA